MTSENNKKSTSQNLRNTIIKRFTRCITGFVTELIEIHYSTF